MKPLGPVSPLFAEHRAALRRAARLGPVLDLACGRGRHALAAAGDGAAVIALDRNAEFLAELGVRGAPVRERLWRLRADVESPPEIPLRSGTCGAVLMFRFLCRPLCPRLVEALHPGGLLLAETFTERQRELAGGPRNPAFLLAAGELPGLFPGLEILAHWEGVTAGDSPTAVAGLAARRPA